MPLYFILYTYTLTLQVPSLGPFELKHIEHAALDFQVMLPSTSVATVTMRQLASASGEYTLSGKTGKLSPCSQVTLSDENRKHANIPQDAAFFAFAYPASSMARGEGRNSLLPQDALSCFTQLGGFVYFDQGMRVCKLSSITLGPGLHFKRQMLSALDGWDRARKVLHDSGRLQEATLKDLVRCGVLSFCWLGPGEVVDGFDSARAQRLWPAQ